MHKKGVPIRAKDIETYLVLQHRKDLCFPEFRLSSGFANESRVDFLAVNVGPSTGNKATAYEIKISRSDYKRDSHKKQRGARLFSDYFFYIAPKGVIPEETIPDWAGLIEVEWKVLGRHYNGGKPFLVGREIIKAPKRDKEAPTWGLFVSAIRAERRQ